MMAILLHLVLGFGGSLAPQPFISPSPLDGITWDDSRTPANHHQTAPVQSRSVERVLAVTMHEGTFLQPDDVPFVGKVFLHSENEKPKQFTCVLTGIERRACVTTAHSLLGSVELTHLRDGTATAKAPLSLTVEIQACRQVYVADRVELATSRIDPITESNRERDVAIITLSEPACQDAEPAVLLPNLDLETAEKWFFPGAATRVPVTIAAYYLGCTLGIETSSAAGSCEQYSSTGYIDSVVYLGGEPVYETTSIGTLPGSSGAPGLVIDTGQDSRSRRDDTFFWICLNVGHRPGGQNACIALENGSFARQFIEARVAF